jgi:RNA polymerase-binding transcription factor DksA
MNPVPPIENTTRTIVRYGDEELMVFKKVIETKLAKAKDELEFTKSQIQDLNENYDEKGGDLDENYIYSEVEMLNNIAIRHQKFVQSLEAALFRIQNKTYGICTATGKLIDKKRLMLVPHATKSVEAKDLEQMNAKPMMQPVMPSIGFGALSSEREDSTTDDDNEDAPKKTRETPKGGSKIITKIVRKVPAAGASTKKSTVADDDDLDDDSWNLDLGEEPSGDINNPVSLENWSEEIPDNSNHNDDYY